MRMLRYRHACPVGIDIRSSEIRLARLARWGKENYRLACAETACLSSGGRSSMMDWSALRDMLGNMVRTLGLKGQPAVVSLPASGVRMQRMPQPANLPAYAIEAAVQGKLRQEMFGATGAFCVDYVELAAESSIERDVYYVASRQELLAQYVECAASAGLDVRIVDVDVFALQRAVSYLLAKPVTRQHVIALLVGSAESVEWIVYDSQTILLHQVIEKETLSSVESLLEVLLKKWVASYSQYTLQQIIISGDINQIDVSSVATAYGVMISYRHSPLCHVLTTSRYGTDELAGYRLLTACGLSMRELPPWC